MAASPIDDDFLIYDALDSGTLVAWTSGDQEIMSSRWRRCVVLARVLIWSARGDVVYTESVTALSSGTLPQVTYLPMVPL